MKDRAGNEITVGARAVLLRCDGMPELVGKIGTIRAMRDKCVAKHNRKAVRISDGPEDYLDWSSWAYPKDVAVVK